MTAGAFSNLTLAVTPVASLTTSSVVAGFIAGESNRSRLYRPDLETLAPQSGDTAATWLPTVTKLTTIQAPDSSSNYVYQVAMKPGTKDTVNVASVQTVTVDADTLFLTATSTW